MSSLKSLAAFALILVSKCATGVLAADLFLGCT